MFFIAPLDFTKKGIRLISLYKPRANYRPSVLTDEERGSS